MILLQLNNITKYFGADPILLNIKLEVQDQDKIALVGRNGAGKSTLLKIIAGEYSYDAGEIIKPNHLEIGYLSQDTGLESELSIWDEMMSVFEPLKKMEQQIREYEVKMGDPNILKNEKAYEKLLQDYDQLQINFKDQGGYQYEADTRSVLHGLNFGNFDYSTPIATLSGGQKTRLALGKLLLTKPNLLILDEPTNHLDIETLSWLEQYLQGYSSALLIVSHDRYFLDQIVTQVYEISRGSSTKYHGNYSNYLIEKAAQYEQEMKLFEKQQTERAKMEEFIQRNIARASTTKRAQSRRKQLEKMTMLDRPLGYEKSAAFSFDISRQSGNDVLHASNLSVSFEPDKSIFNNLNLHITRGDSIALVGPNGVGKSTLLKTITKKIVASGEINYGSNVTIGYFDQEQASLHSNKTVLQELWDEYPDQKEKDIRSILGNFLFSGDDVLKVVSSLSGGEKVRLTLAKLMMQKANFLLLDEPTNHLDLDSKEILENALIDYPGTILFVSHDRYFINRIATKIWELTSDGLTTYLGDYTYYIEKKAELQEIENLEKNTFVTTTNIEPQNDKIKYIQDKELKKEERRLNRRIEEIENEIAMIEEKMVQNDLLLCDPIIFQDYEKTAELNNENEMLHGKLENLMEEWEKLQEEISKIDL